LHQRLFGAPAPVGHHIGFQFADAVFGGKAAVEVADDLVHRVNGRSWRGAQQRAPSVLLDLDFAEVGEIIDDLLLFRHGEVAGCESGQSGVTTRFVQNRTPTELAGRQGPSLRNRGGFAPQESRNSSAKAEAGSDIRFCNSLTFPHFSGLAYDFGQTVW
jgi:hypothetical protein